MVDLLYVAHNRLEFTRATFAALVANTTWERVNHLFVLDDDSEDGTRELLMHDVAELYARTGMKVDCVSDRFGGPVAAMNYALDHAETDVLVKVDNDLLVCPGWLDVLVDVLDEHQELDVLGFEAGFGGALAASWETGALFDVKPAPHVGGIGAFRTRLFARRRPVQRERFFGMTTLMRAHASCAWLTPDLPCPLLDHLPFEPWRSLAVDYVERGWSRSWPVYPESMRDYWAWWSEAPVPA